MVLFLVPIRDNQRLMDDAIPIDGTKEIPVRDLLECHQQACRNDKGPEYRKALLQYNNIPSKMKLSYDSTTDEWSLTLVGFRGMLDNNRTVASFYVDGGKIENKVAPYATFKLVEGSVIEFRPPPQYRHEKFMRHLKFMVVADADADADANVVDADDGVEEEAEVVPVVDAGTDDVVEEAAAEVVPFVVVVVDADTDANDGVKEAEEVEEEQLVRFP